MNSKSVALMVVMTLWGCRSPINDHKETLGKKPITEIVETTKAPTLESRTQSNLKNEGAPQKQIQTPSKQSPPGFNTIQKLAGGGFAHSPGLQLGDHTWVSAVSYPVECVVKLIVVQWRDSQWTLKQQHPIPFAFSKHPDQMDDEGLGCCYNDESDKECKNNNEYLKASIFVDDYDNDGQTEVMVRTSYSWMWPGSGFIGVRDVNILNVGEIVSIALNIALDGDGPSWRTHAKANVTDKNDDGFPDIEIVGSEESSDIEGIRPLEPRIFLWDQKTDSYLPKNKDHRFAKWEI